MGLIFALGMAALLAACGAAEQAGEQQTGAKVVRIVQVERGELERQLRITGQVVPQAEINVAVKTGGKVAQALVKVGDQVQQGQVLLRLETSELGVQVRQAEAGLAAARARLAETRAGAREQQLAQARSQLKQAEINRDAAQTNRERVQYLFDQGAVARQQLEGANTQYQVAEATLETARQALALLEAGASAEQLAMLAAEVQRAEAGLELTRAQLASAVVTAPISGTVAARMLNPGEMVGPGQPVFTLVRLHPAVVRASVTERDINRLQVGQGVAVAVAAADRQDLQGLVTSIGPVIDQRTRTFTVEMEVPNSDGQLKGGMTATLQLVLEREQDVVVVPLEAVLQRGDRQVVFVVQDGHARATEVILGLADDRRAAVRQGLAAGSQVVVAGHQALKDGDRVMIAGGGNQL